MSSRRQRLGIRRRGGRAGALALGSWLAGVAASSLAAPPEDPPNSGDSGDSQAPPTSPGEVEAGEGGLAPVNIEVSDNPDTEPPSGPDDGVVSDEPEIAPESDESALDESDESDDEPGIELDEDLEDLDADLAGLLEETVVSSASRRAESSGTAPGMTCGASASGPSTKPSPTCR